MTTYAEFRLKIERGTSRRIYRVEASGLGGEEEGRFRVPFSPTELENFVLKVGRTRKGVRRLESPEMELARLFGGRLFAAVMEGKVGELYRSAFSEARAAGQGLRVTLSLTAAPELGGIPWEYLYDSTDFLSISTWTPVVRYLDLPKPRRALEVQLPLRILGVVSAPSDYEPLDASAERAKLETALKPLFDQGAVEIDWLEEPNLLALQRKMRSDTYHILHFIGHGGFDDKKGEGALLFEDEGGRGRLVSGDMLAPVLKDKVALRLVVLNSCEGARNSVDDPFSGVATSLVEREVPAVIGMQFEITDRAAILFATEFYTVLAEGQPVDQAITEARLAIFADHNDVEWATPVLFMRVADGQLFDIADATPLPRSEPAGLPPKAEVPVGAVEGVPGATSTTEPAAAPTAGSSAAPAAGPAAAPPAAPAAARAAGPDRATAAGHTDASPGPPTQPIASAATVVDTATTRTPRLTLPAGWQKVAISAVAVIAVILVGIRLLSSAGSVTPSQGSSNPSGQASSNPSGQASSNPTGPVASQPGGGPASFPPGSDGILFYSDVDEAGSTDRDVELFRIDPVSGAIEQLTSNSKVDDGYPTWSPDHDRIAFARGPGGDRDIWVRDQDGGESRLTSGPADDYFPAWSKDGLIAFHRVEDRDTSGIWVVRSDATGAHEVIAGRVLRAPAWSPDGQTIAFFGDHFEPAFDVFTIKADATGLNRLTLESTYDRNPSWSPDGKTIAFVRGGTTSAAAANDIYLLDVATKQITRRLTKNTVQDGNPVFSPDGTQIAFYRKSTTGYHLWVMNADGTGQRDLMPEREGDNLDPIWR